MLFAVAFFLFLSTPSARRATIRHDHTYQQGLISIHALREEGDFIILTSRAVFSDFYPRPPRGGRPPGLFIYVSRTWISIHALREEGDAVNESGKLTAYKFLSTPSARRATPLMSTYRPSSFNFYPRPPRGGRRHISRCRWAVSFISIHALREEGDATITACNWHSDGFLSTPSARRATRGTAAGRRGGEISIHALREEGDRQFFMSSAVR